jgi:hypothetical protein
MSEQWISTKDRLPKKLDDTFHSEAVMLADLISRSEWTFRINVAYCYYKELKPLGFILTPKKALYWMPIPSVENSPLQNGWIDVNDRLPQEKIINCVKKCDRILTASFNKYSSGEWWFDVNNYLYGDTVERSLTKDKVKFWMPLPHPPKKG